jgi:hypothetical protein
MKDGLGIVESPNFPGEYPANSECHWRVRPGRNKRVLVIISNIELDESCGDVLTIRKSGEAQLLCFCIITIKRVILHPKLYIRNILSNQPVAYNTIPQ